MTTALSTRIRVDTLMSFEAYCRVRPLSQAGEISTTICRFLGASMRLRRMSCAFRYECPDMSDHRLFPQPWCSGAQMQSWPMCPRCEAGVPRQVLPTCRPSCPSWSSRSASSSATHVRTCRRHEISHGLPSRSPRPVLHGPGLLQCCGIDHPHDPEDHGPWGGWIRGLGLGT